MRRKKEKEDRLRIYARICGRVQGVGFRHYTKEHADRFNLTGWVKNRPDGDVELEAQGKRADVIRLISALNQGPPMAFVQSVREHHTDLVDWEESFRVRR